MSSFSAPVRIPTIAGVLTRIHHALHAEVRALEGKPTTPTLAIVDSQPVKSAGKGAKD